MVSPATRFNNVFLLFWGALRETQRHSIDDKMEWLERGIDFNRH